MIGIGGPAVIVAGLIGTAVATGLRRAQVFEQCMVAQGYQKAGGQTAPQPTPASAKLPARAPTSAKATPARAG